jgi:hypothetical protein
VSDPAQVLLGVMALIHSEAMAPAFNRLLMKEMRSEDHVTLVHVFEEVSVLALHRLIPEDLLFDAFAFDMYWDELQEDVVELRRRTGNQKLGENFEIAAERAAEHRRRYPTKLRWGKEPPQGGWPGGGGQPRTPPPSPAPEPLEAPPVSES